MTGILLIPMIVAATLFSFSAEAVTPGTPLDVSAVRSVVVSGDAGSIHLTTAADKPYTATIRNRRSGWFSRWYSSWFFNDCREGGHMELREKTLYIEVAQPSWMDLSDCVPEISANLPGGSSVRIDQHALQAVLSGDFDTVAFSSNAADITLEGHASTVYVSGNAVRAHLAYTTIGQGEKVDIHSNSLDAYLAFGAGVPVAYSVVARASFVDAAPSVSGGNPVVSIKGDYVHATIR